MKIVATPINNSKVVIKFLNKNIFTRFGTLRTLLRDDGTYSCNKPLESSLKKCGGFHKVVTPCHYKTSGQFELFNYELKSILEKTVYQI